MNAKTAVEMREKDKPEAHSTGSRASVSDLRSEIDHLIADGDSAPASLLLRELWTRDSSSSAASFVVSRYEQLRPQLNLLPYRLVMLRSFTVEPMVPLLRASEHPRVVNVASGAGPHGDAVYGLAARGGAAASYGISKAAVLALTSTLAAELAGTPIIVNAVDPDLTATWPGAEASGARPASLSALGVVWAATLPGDGLTGGLFLDGRPVG